MSGFGPQLFRRPEAAPTAADGGVSPRCDLQGDKPEEELELEIHHPILEYSGGAKEQQRRKKRRERDSNSESEEPSYCKLVLLSCLGIITHPVTPLLSPLTAGSSRGGSNMAPIR